MDLLKDPVIEYYDWEYFIELNADFEEDKVNYLALKETLMKSSESKVEASLKNGKVTSFLNDLVELCLKHRVSIDTDSEDTVIEFFDWEYFIRLDVDSEGASLYWPRIQTDIVVERKK